ncbi:MAG: tetratricopeptide repeat protein [Pseudomonadota bacterium]
MTILNKEKILEQARAFIEEGKLDKAIREYEKIILADPTDLRIKLRVAELYTKRKQINNAIRIYREVADSYTSEGFLLKAVTVFKNILRLNPSLIEVNEELAQLYEKMGLVSDAVRQYDILASALDMRGMKEKVVEVRKKIVSLNPKEGGARIRLAELLQREGYIDESIDQYELYAKQLEERECDKDKLADLYEKILAHRPGNTELIRKLIDIYEVREEHKKALKWLERAKDVVESDSRLMKLAAKIYASQNQTETARMKYMELADHEAKAENIDAALDAYYEILLLLPDEEDRLFKRVEELRSGAMKEISERALKRRKELEEEELQKQAAEEAGEVMAEQEHVSAEEVTPAPKAPPEPSKKEVPPEAPLPPIEKKPEIDKRKADAAYDLGTTYQKMGLRNEANKELKKAFEIYDAYLKEGHSDSSVAQRVKSIEAVLAGEKEPEKPAEKPAPSKPSSEKKEKKEGKKKRISFV